MTRAPKATLASVTVRRNDETGGGRIPVPAVTLDDAPVLLLLPEEGHVYVCMYARYACRREGIYVNSRDWMYVHTSAPKSSEVGMQTQQSIRT